MKKIAYILLVVALLGCSVSVRPQEFNFYDSHGKAYTSKTAASEVQNEYQLKEKPKIILIATNSVSQAQFKKQMDAISEVDPESLQYMYVVANSEDEDRSGYYTTVTTAIKLLSGEPFRITIYNGCGRPITLSDQVLSKTELIDYLTNTSAEQQGPCRP